MGDQINVEALGAAIGAALAPYMSERQKHDLPAGYTVSTNKPHGTTGIFGASGIDRDIFSTRVTPTGLLEYLPAIMTNDTNPIVGYLTGFTAGSGAEQETPCDDPPTPGEMKSCFQGSAFGRIARATEVIDFSASGERANRGEYTDLRLVNDPLLSNPELLVPSTVPQSLQGALASEIVGKLYALGVEFEDVLSHMVWTGTPANNVGTGYAEFLGMESLVKTGHTDVLTGASCPSLDSLIMDFQYNKVEDAAATLFHYLTTMWRVTNKNARSMNMMPVQFAFVMVEPLFREIVDYWPCVYASYRCNANANDLSNSTDALTMRMMSDEMFNGRYLQIDGVRVPVILDDSMPVQYNKDDARVGNTCLASDIYLLPLTVKGGRLVTYMEAFNFNAPNAAISEMNQMGGAGSGFMWSDGGKFLWTPRQTLWCFSWAAVIRPRLRLLTPHLAARLENVVACPLVMPRQPFADDPYHTNGGNTVGDFAQYSVGDLYL